MQLFCNLQSWTRTHAILVIGLYELGGKPTTQLIEPPEPFYYYHWVATAAGGLLVFEGIIRLAVSVSTLTLFIRYIYY